MNKRHGTTQVELVIATVLMVAMLATIAAFRKQTIVSAQISQRSSFAQSHLLNMCREVSTWPIEEVTSEKISQQSGDNSDFLPGARWVAEVTEMEQPIVGKRIVLALHWQEGTRDQSSPSLTFWMEARKP